MGQHELRTDGEGVVELTLSADFGLAEAVELKETLLQALASASEKLVVDLREIGAVELPFFQLLFATSVQARRDGRRVCLRRPLPGLLLKSSGQLGISSMDFEQAFDPE